MITWLPIIISSLILLLSIAVFLSAHFMSKSSSDIQRRLESLEGTILTPEKKSEFERRLTQLETRLEIAWDIIEKYMSNILHSPHTPELDRLLEKNQRGESFDVEELREFTGYLQHIICEDEKASKGEQAVAALLLASLASKYLVVRSWLYGGHEVSA